MASTGRRGHVSIQRQQLTNPDLTDKAMRVMLWLDSHTDDFLADVNESDIADAFGWTWKTARRHTTILEDLGLITRDLLDRRGGGTRTQYTLHQSEWSESNPAVRLPTGGSKQPNGVRSQQPNALGQNDSTALGQNDPPTTSTLQLEESTSRNPPTPATVPMLADDVGGAFESFWSKYPNIKNRKVHKVKTKRKFEMIAKRGDLSEVREGARYWFRVWATDAERAQFCPQPYNWLHGEHWRADACTDVLEPKRQSKNMATVTSIDLQTRLAEIDARNQGIGS